MAADKFKSRLRHTYTAVYNDDGLLPARRLVREIFIARDQILSTTYPLDARDDTLLSKIYKARIHARRPHTILLLQGYETERRVRTPRNRPIASPHRAHALVPFLNSERSEGSAATRFSSPSQRRR